jgi:hypothetical protein
MRDVVVAGAGLHRYGVFPDKTSIDLGTVAIQRALDDAAACGRTLRRCTTVQCVWGYPLGTIFVGTWG